MILNIEKSVKENKEKLPIAEVEKVEKALENAKKVLKEKENDPEALQKETDDLMKASHKIAEIIYKEEQAKTQQAKEKENPSTDETVQQQSANKKSDGPIDVDAV